MFHSLLPHLRKDQGLVFDFASIDLFPARVSWMVSSFVGVKTLSLFVVLNKH